MTTVTQTQTVTTAAGTPVLVTNKTTPPVGYHHTALQVLAIARQSAVVKAELRKHPTLVAYEYTKGAPQWQVSWFTPPKTGTTQRELVQVYVDDDTGKVTQAWTGFQVAWTMARGYDGAFGRIVNAWYIWLPVCLMFVLPFIPWRRRPTLLHLDLAMFLFFSVSLAFFNHADIGMSTPLFYVPLIYLLVRLLALGYGVGVPREPLRTIVPAGWLIVGIIFLMAFRIGLNVLDSNVIDVGFSGVIGADKLIHNVPLYGHWPSNDAYGDTYGPFNYFVYVPFRLVLGWSGAWDSPARRARRIDLLRLRDARRALRAGPPLARSHARRRARLRLGRLPVHDVVALLQHERQPRRADRHRGAARARLGSRPRRDGRARRPDEVRPVHPHAAAVARRRRAAASPLGDRLRGRVRGVRVPLDAPGDRQAQPPSVLARLDQVPVRSGHAVLGVGPVGRPGLAAAHAPGRGRRARADRRACCRRVAPRCRWRRSRRR